MPLHHVPHAVKAPLATSAGRSGTASAATPAKNKMSVGLGCGAVGRGPCCLAAAEGFDGSLTRAWYSSERFSEGKNEKAIEYWKNAKTLGSTNKNLDKKIDKKEYYEPLY